MNTQTQDFPTRQDVDAIILEAQAARAQMIRAFIARLFRRSDKPELAGRAAA